MTAETNAAALADHEIAQVVNQLRDIAIEFHATQQLRERIAHLVVPLLRAGAAKVPDRQDWRTTLTVNLLRYSTALTKSRIRALIDFACDGIEPPVELFATPPAPDALRWCASCGEGVTTFCRGSQPCAEGLLAPDAGVVEPTSMEAMKERGAVAWAGVDPGGYDSSHGTHLQADGSVIETTTHGGVEVERVVHPAGSGHWMQTATKGTQ